MSARNTFFVLVVSGCVAQLWACGASGAGPADRAALPDAAAPDATDAALSDVADDTKRDVDDSASPEATATDSGPEADAPGDAARDVDAESPETFAPVFVRIPGGSYQMGDHFNFVDPAHPSDELPLHTVNISALTMSTTLLTTREYVDFLNAALAGGLIEVTSGSVHAVGGTEVYVDTTAAIPLSTIGWVDSRFTVRSGRELHPATGVRWFGAIAYCNWLSARDGYDSAYDLKTGDCDLSRNGYRLPTEAEWEYAARGGQTDPYYQFPWGNDTNADGELSNWQNSGDPWENGDYPHTTPVGFYNGTLRRKSDHGWPADVATYQTRDGSNAFGLYDMAGNVWEWVNDWYQNTYYAYCVTNNIVDDPPGPAAGDIMQGGLPWRGLRGGTWWNGGGQQFYGYSRVSNRDPSWSLGGSPDGHPESAWLQVGFRVMRPDRIAGATARLQDAGAAFAGGGKRRGTP